MDILKGVKLTNDIDLCPKILKNVGCFSGGLGELLIVKSASILSAFIPELWNQTRRCKYFKKNEYQNEVQPVWALWRSEFLGWKRPFLCLEDKEDKSFLGSNGSVGSESDELVAKL